MNFSATQVTNRPKSVTTRFLAIAITTALTTAPLTAVSDELVVNGGFEEPDLTELGYDDTSWTTFFGQNADEDWCSSNGFPACNDDTQVPGWDVVWQDSVLSGEFKPGRLEIQRGFLAGSRPYRGEQKAELDSHHRADSDGNFDPDLDHNVVLSQGLNTCPRAAYTLSYAWRPRTLTEDDNDMLVLIDDKSLIEHTNLVQEWTTETFNFISNDSPPSQLGFTSLGTATTLGMFLDEVSVQGPDGSQPEACETIPVCGSKPAQLEMLYNGPFEREDFFTQDPGEVEIETFTDDDEPLPDVVNISVHDHLYGKRNAREPLFNGEVTNGDTFTFSGTRGRKKLVPPKIYIEISKGGDLLQRVTFHTSCSQPLNVGDQFGGVAVFGFTP